MNGKRFWYAVLIYVGYRVIKDDFANTVAEKLAKLVVGEPKRTCKKRPQYGYFKNHMFASREQAQTELDALREHIGRFGDVSIYAFYTMVDNSLRYDQGSSEYGWTELGDDVLIIESVGEGYFIGLPRPVYLDS
jgi:hypothetical protein